jgi:hypothetical protein
VSQLPRPCVDRKPVVWLIVWICKQLAVIPVLLSSKTITYRSAAQCGRYDGVVVCYVIPLNLKRVAGSRLGLEGAGARPTKLSPLELNVVS